MPELWGEAEMTKRQAYQYKSDHELVSDFNMGASFLKFLCDEVMTEVASRAVSARDNPRFRTIEQYYSIVRELWNQAESVWTKNESDEVEEFLNKISKNIGFIERKLYKPEMELVYEIELAQRVVYNTIRKYNMLVPVSVEPNTREEKLRLLRTAFGLDGRTSKDNEGEFEDG